MFNGKAIPTEYGGYYFRSRREARWAVVFNEIGTEFMYEPEGFELDGVRYLPDFWLPKSHMWFEVKGQEPSEYEWEKIFRLSRHELVVVAIGECGLGKTRFCMCADDAYTPNIELYLCPQCQAIALRFPINETDTEIVCRENGHSNTYVNNYPDPKALIGGYLLETAYDKARKARFGR